ncbi:MAG: 1-deoxy-D-xylulose-5-phosphate reductoisomerase [Firmicutes bacterium]|nr:1-deoxy-D-xylulose-5-phosphate reductoisomerase [Bacillota bacterium]
MKNIVILGSTGSIGRQTLAVVRSMPDRFRVVGLAAGSNWRLLAGQIREFRPVAAALAGAEALTSLSRELGAACPELASGRAGLESLAQIPSADLVVVAVTGAAGIYPTIAAIRAGKDVALANKETLVAAGEPVTGLAKRKGVRLLPVDSEHSAIWQCLRGETPAAVAKIILTASGGPFRETEREKLAFVTPEMALAHPNWQMGKKITVDSATLMNKGLEVIEARWLFEVDYNQIEVVVHPQSIIHSAVEFCDGSVIAQMGLPDMRLPIQYALTYPDRLKSGLPRLRFADLAGLTFIEPDHKRFPALKLAYEAGKAGGTMPAVLNAANEVAVGAFLQGRIRFPDITAIVAAVMEQHHVVTRPSLDAIMEADRLAREAAIKLAGR